VKNIERRIKRLEEKINPDIHKEKEKAIKDIGYLIECYIKECPSITKPIKTKVKKIREELEVYVRENMEKIWKNRQLDLKHGDTVGLVSYSRKYLRDKYTYIDNKLTEWILSWNGEEPEKLTRMFEEEEKNEKL